MLAPDYPWQRPLGATPLGDGHVEFRVWCTTAERVAVRVRGRDHELAPAGYDVWEARVEAAAGDDYVYVLDGRAWPDPCSRSQPEGVRGASRVVDPGAFAWTDGGWGGVPLADLVLYELHVGTFTREGTFEAVVPRLEELAALGVTAIELMPVATFPGERNWGYDGLYTWAPHPAYGGPEGLARLVDAAHAAGVAVVLDVVYNHVGPGSEALAAFGPYFTEKYGTFWGAAINYDDALADPVREWAIQNACMWARDYHLDGLRLDAIHAIYDFSARHVLADLGERAHAAAERPFWLVAESGLNDPKVVRPAHAGGWGLDAQWADDFHHALRVLLTGERDGYYADFGCVADLAKAYVRPFVHDGTYSRYRRRTFGAPAFDRPPHQFVVFAQNHDQVGNRALGDRLPLEARPLAAFATLLAPFLPMLFMGEEYGETRPFQFFTDHIDPFIADATREGRRKEFAAFTSFSEEIPDPQDEATFARSRLDPAAGDPGTRALYAELLRLRRELPAGEVTTEFSEDERWLRVTRGEFELLMNFAREPRRVATGGREVVLAAGGVALEHGTARLDGLTGALVR